MISKVPKSYDFLPFISVFSVYDLVCQAMGEPRMEKVQNMMKATHKGILGGEEEYIGEVGKDWNGNSEGKCTKLLALHKDKA